MSLTSTPSPSAIKSSSSSLPESFQFIPTSTFSNPFSSSFTTEISTFTSANSTNNNNNGPTIASSASLYLYTFLATLVLLLSVSAAIVTRSFVIRRRHQRMIEEAIRNGTWIPPAPSISGGRGPRVDLSKKPSMWEAYLGEYDAAREGNESMDEKTGMGHKEKSALEGVGGVGWSAGAAWAPYEWEMIRPITAAYVLGKPSPSSPSSSLSTGGRSAPGPITSTNPDGLTTPPSDIRSSPPTTQRQGESASLASPVSIPPTHPPESSPPSQEPRNARTIVRDLARLLSPTPAATSPLPGPPSSSAQDRGQDDGTGHDGAGAMQGLPPGPRRVQVAVLISMPAPRSETGVSSSKLGGSSSGSVSSSNAHASAAKAADDEPPPLPHLEMGIAELLVHGENDEDEDKETRDGNEGGVSNGKKSMGSRDGSLDK